MSSPLVVEQRLKNQFITRQHPRGPADVVAWFGAVQAQEYAPAKWGLGIRMRDTAIDADIQHALDQGLILRTHVMRPTWHFVAPADIWWLLELTAPRVHRVMAPYNRQLGLDAVTMTRGTAIFERALRDNQYLTRTELGERLNLGGLAMDGIRLAHLAMHAELEGVICSGPRRGKRSTYALIAERAPAAVKLSRDEALAELTRRYFRSHGPATIRDFVWWSGLLTADAKRGLEINRARPHEAGGLTYWTLGGPARGRTRERPVLLLPIYDEYVIAYRDRQAAPLVRPTPKTASRAFVQFQHALVIDGYVAGTWRTVRPGQPPALDVIPLRPLKKSEQRGLGEAVADYGRFLGTPLKLSVK